MVVQNDYFTFLGRDATSQDISFWVARFSQGAENEDIVAGFIASSEYYNGRRPRGRAPAPVGSTALSKSLPTPAGRQRSELLAAVSWLTIFNVRWDMLQGLSLFHDG